MSSKLYPWDARLNVDGAGKVRRARFAAGFQKNSAESARVYLEMLGDYTLLSVRQHADAIGVGQSIFYYALHDKGWENPAAGVWLSPGRPGGISPAMAQMSDSDED